MLNSYSVSGNSRYREKRHKQTKSELLALATFSISKGFHVVLFCFVLVWGEGLLCTVKPIRLSSNLNNLKPTHQSFQLPQPLHLSFFSSALLQKHIFKFNGLNIILSKVLEEKRIGCAEARSTLGSDRLSPVGTVLLNFSVAERVCSFESCCRLQFVESYAWTRASACLHVSSSNF